MELVQFIALLCVMSKVAWGHGGHGDHDSGKPLEFASEIHNKDHILEHLSNVIATKSKEQLTDEELEFHYFKLHDYDNNNKLDGVEIGKALTHFHDGGDDKSTEPSGTKNPKAEPTSDEVLSSTIDMVLTRFDTNRDGYIEYFEYKAVNQNDKKP